MAKMNASKAGYHHGNLRPALLTAALELLNESGIESLSLRAVARRAGVSSGAPYHHFEHKGDLICELAKERLLHLHEVSAKAIKGKSNPKAKLRAIGLAYITYAVEHPAEFRLMFSPERGSPFDQEVPDEAPVFSILLQVIDELIEEGLEIQRDTAAITAWSLVHGLANLLVDGPLQPMTANAEQVRTLARGVTDGLIFVRE